MSFERAGDGEVFDESGGSGVGAVDAFDDVRQRCMSLAPGYEPE
jgi:hypothetical protein